MTDRTAIAQRPNTQAPAVRPQGRPRGSAAWAVAAVFIVGMLLAGIPFVVLAITWGRSIATGPARIGGALTQMAADALRPQVSIRTIAVSGIEDLQRQQKLVVLTPVVSADITRQEGGSSWGMYWGTNVARVVVKNARTQYAIDLSQEGTADYRYDEAAKTLTLYVPRPRLDTQMVSIDPAQIETVDLRGGWARWDKQETKDHAIAELKPAIIVQATKPFIRKQAEEAGMEAMRTLVAPMIQALKPEGVTVEVRYRD